MLQICMFTGNNSACVFCSFSYSFYFIGDKRFAGYFKDEIRPSLKANDRLKFSQDVALDHVREKGKTTMNTLI